MANTYVQIGSTITVGSGGAATIDFTSIPATYTDLIVKTSLRCNNSGADMGIIISFNGIGTSYADLAAYGNGTAAGSVGSSGVAGVYWFYANGNTATANTFSNGEFYIPNYAGSNNKSVSMDSATENNATGNLMLLASGLWSNSAAINRITLTPNTNSFMQYSTVTLYGIKNS
jgi:hypothetical protein